jgi:uncharacterized membrane-anchored protein YjiN (DUF445 family)
MSAPSFAVSWDEERARGLAVARRRATGLLVLAAFILVTTYVFTDGTGFWGYLRAAAEAGVIGGVADWFAVTALFRHPLGVPIPHTAIIARGKALFGRGLGDFIANNFLDQDHLSDRLRDLDPAARLGEWLVRPSNAEAVTRRAGGVIAGIADALGDEEIQENLQRAVEERIRALELTPMLGGAIELAMEGGHHHVLIDATLRGVARTIEENQDLLQERIHQESPWWMPEPVDQMLFEKVYDGVQRFVRDVTADPDHEIRRHLDTRALQLADRLKASPELRAQGEQLKAEMLNHPEYQAWAEGLWTDLKQQLVRAAGEPESELRRRLQAWTITTGERLAHDSDLRHRVNTWVVSMSRQVVEQSGGEVADLIASTVDRWDAREASRRLELLLGRDLQFIRINGTLVGALVGLLIHSVTQIAA